MAKNTEKLTQGFTLVELIITVGIMTFVSSVILFENGKFNSSILLTNLAYEAALNARQAQVFGLSSRQAPGTTSTNVGYGVYFDINSPQQFIFFADTNITGGNKNSFQPEETINTLGITNRNYISDICRRKNDLKCAIADGDTTLNKVNITFLRPDPEPIFKYEAAGPTYNILDADYVVIVFKTIGNDEDKRCMVVTNAGQISIKSQNFCQ